MWAICGYCTYDSRTTFGSTTAFFEKEIPWLLSLRAQSTPPHAENGNNDDTINTQNMGGGITGHPTGIERKVRRLAFLVFNFSPSPFFIFFLRSVWNREGKRRFLWTGLRQESFYIFLCVLFFLWICRCGSSGGLSSPRYLSYSHMSSP